MPSDEKPSKQSTLDNLAYHFDIQKTRGKDKPNKAILIEAINYDTKENELDLKVAFRLIPKESFSKIVLDMFFQDCLLKSVLLSIPQSLILSDRLEYPIALDMTGMREGDYAVRVEIYELWDAKEKINFNSEEKLIHYVPKSRQELFVEIPTIKSVPGADLTVLSAKTKELLSELDQNLKRESENRKDYW